LDPFAGSGTTVAVAEELGRDAILIDIDPVSIAIQKQRIAARSLVEAKPEPIPAISDTLPSKESPAASLRPVNSPRAVTQRSLWEES
jgi:tetrahydromethanopterin S-methyltransferase subunit B